MDVVVPIVVLIVLVGGVGFALTYSADDAMKKSDEATSERGKLGYFVLSLVLGAGVTVVLMYGSSTAQKTYQPAPPSLQAPRTFQPPPPSLPTLTP